MRSAPWTASYFRKVAEESPRQFFVLFESFAMEEELLTLHRAQEKWESGSQGISPVCFS